MIYNTNKNNKFGKIKKQNEISGKIVDIRLRHNSNLFVIKKKTSSCFVFFVFGVIKNTAPHTTKIKPPSVFGEIINYYIVLS